jgi:hypothetical protein
MMEMSRKYWTLAIIVVMIIVFFSVAEYFTEQLAATVKKRRSRPRSQQVAPVSPSSAPTNAPAPPVGRRFR